MPNNVVLGKDLTDNCKFDQQAKYIMAAQDNSNRSIEYHKSFQTYTQPCIPTIKVGFIPKSAYKYIAS